MISVLRYVLLVVEVVSCFLLIGVILLQKTKGQGIGMAFGAGVGESLFGAQVGNVLTKTTVILAIIFLVNTTILSLLGLSRGSGSVIDSVRVKGSPASLPVPSEIPASMPESGVEEIPPLEPANVGGDAALPSSSESADTDKTSPAVPN